MTNVAIMSVWNESCKALAELTQPARNAYAARHGYNVIARRIDHDLRYWIKPSSINEELVNWEWIVWMDVDTLITNHDIMLSSIVMAATEYPDMTFPDFICSFDLFGLNAGVLFIKNTEWSRRFVNAWCTTGMQRYRNYPTQDQCALANMLYREPKQKWCCLPQSYFNAYDYSLYEGQSCPSGQHHSGSFILHLPGLGEDIRIRKIKEVLG